MVYLYRVDVCVGESSYERTELRHTFVRHIMLFTVYMSTRLARMRDVVYSVIFRVQRNAKANQLHLPRLEIPQGRTECVFSFKTVGSASVSTNSTRNTRKRTFFLGGYTGRSITLRNIRLIFVIFLLYFRNMLIKFYPISCIGDDCDCRYSLGDSYTSAVPTAASKATLVGQLVNQLQLCQIGNFASIMQQFKDCKRLHIIYCECIINSYVLIGQQFTRISQQIYIGST